MYFINFHYCASKIEHIFQIFSTICPTGHLKILKQLAITGIFQRTSFYIRKHYSIKKTLYPYFDINEKNRGRNRYIRAQFFISLRLISYDKQKNHPCKE